MQFPQNVVTELTAPNNVAFVPGNNVSGFGTDVPPELLAAGYTNAIVFYSTDWNPTNTVPTTKFRFIATAGASLVIGIGYCLNPSVSQTATVTRTISAGLLLAGSVPLNDVEFYNINNISMLELAQGVDGNANPDFVIRDHLGNTRARISYTAAATQTFMLLGGAQLTVNDAAGSAIQTSVPIVKDTGWQPFTLFNGWFGNAAPDAPLYRMMPDGTIQFTGLINKGSAPVSGEKWGSVAAGYLPKGQGGFHACSALTVDGNQKIFIDTAGNCTIFDVPAGNGSACLSGIRYPSATLLP